MHMLDLVTDIAMASSSGMEISEPFRTEDLSKTDFFDFVTGSAPDMAISSSSGGSASGGNASSNRVMSGVGLGGTVTDRPPGGGGGGRNGNADGTLDGSPANRSATSTAGNPTGDANDQPLQGFDQFWGSDKDANRLDPAMFEDLNRYCWIQQNNNNNNNNSSAANNNSTTNNNNGALNHQVADTDGQIYTLTVLNGAPEPWVLRKDPTTSSEPAAPASNLDLDTILGGFPGYVKTECFSYDDSGFGTDHHAKEDPHQQQQQHQQHLLVQQQHQHLQQQVQPQQQQQQMPVTSSNIVLSSNLLDPNSVLAYQNNNNNDWQMSDHNVIQQETPESLLRSALQGKGYTKGMQQLQNGVTVGGGAVTVLPSPGHMKDDELRRVLYATHGDPTDSLSAYADSTLTSSIYDESVLHSPASTNQSVQQHHQQQQQQQQLAGDLGGGPGGPGSGPGSVVVDDMFLTLDAAFTEDYEKLKRIATEVQQFCTDNNNYAEIIVETGSSIVGNNGLSATAANNHNLGHGNGAPSLLNSSSSTVATSNNHHPLILSSPTTPTAAPGAGLQQRQPTVSTTTCSDVVTTTSTTKAKTPRAKKSYKRSLSTSNSAGGAVGNATGTGAQNPSSSAILATGNTNLTCLATPHSNHNNNNNTNMSNLNTMLSPNGGAAGGTGSGSTTTSTTTTTTSPTQCGNGQRKERSLHYCSICSKGFKDKYSVNVHIRTHTGEKPFACSLCGKSFRQKAHLAKHYQTHLAQKNPAASAGAGVGTVSKQSKQSRLAAPPPPILADPSGVPPVPPPPPPPPPGLLATSVGPPPIGVDNRLDMSPPLLLNTPAASSAANNTAPPIVASR